jgi:hypothetical protein
MCQTQYEQQFSHITLYIIKLQIKILRETEHFWVPIENQ